MGRRRDAEVLPSHRRIDEMTSRGRSGEFWPFKPWFPWLIPTFVVANVVLFAATMYVNDCPSNSSQAASLEGRKETQCLFGEQLGRFAFQPFKENPLLGPSTTALTNMGALEEGSIMVSGGQTWRIFTCIWLHGGVFHILANMLSLVLIGIRLEKEFGFVRIGILYVISGLGGSLLSALFMQAPISVGASGALFGLLGSMLSELLTNWTIYENKVSALTVLVLVIVVNLAFGILPHVDNFAHIGGFVSGFLIGFIILIRPQFGYINYKTAPPQYRIPHKRKHKIYQIVLLVIAAIILVALFVVGFLALFRGVNVKEMCSWCHYLSCVPTSRWSCKQNQNKACLTSRQGNTLSLTCLGTNRTKLYVLPDPNASNIIYQLCADFCSF